MSLDFICDLNTEYKSGHSRRYCIARCSYCGNEFKVLKQNVKNQKSCGCVSGYLKGLANKIHGLNPRNSKNKIYRKWSDIKQRCLNSKHKRYHRYGGRGITICDEWKYNYKSFHVWAINNGYKDGLTIDRIDNDLGYSPDNCEWVTLKENIRRRDIYHGYNTTNI